MVLSFDLHKKRFIRSRVCRTILTRNALESSDPGGSNGAPTFLIRLFGADLVNFEVGGGLQNLEILRYSCPIGILDPPLDAPFIAPESGLSSAL